MFEIFKGGAWRERNDYDDNDDENNGVDFHQRFAKLGVSWRFWRQRAESKAVDRLPVWIVLPYEMRRGKKTLMAGQESMLHVLELLGTKTFRIREFSILAKC